jgi:hypothetical protein
MVEANGGHVIRRNKIVYTGSPNVHGRDCVVSSPNFDDIQNTVQDTDIYDNYCQGATDDGISLDGNSANVRVWGNEIWGSMVGISIAPVVMPIFFAPTGMTPKTIGEMGVDGSREGNMVQGMSTFTTIR